MKIYSFSPFGYEGSLVSIEVDVRRGIPAVDIVGLADGAVKESRERMRSAIRNSGYEFPPERVLISLSPADLKKEGAGFDLAIALAVLQARLSQDEEKEPQEEEPVLVMGELELSGLVRGVRAVNAAASTASALGIKKCIIPRANITEARGVDGIKIFGAETLKEAYEALCHQDSFYPTGKAEGTEEKSYGPTFSPYVEEEDFAFVKGQEFLVRGLQIAAAGGHNLLAFGPPGCGKTLALMRFKSLLPDLTQEESLSATRIHSIAGLLAKDTTLIKVPPFRQPHQSASIEGMCGGGSHCMPGEISIAHNGVLFLDEAAEFRTSVLQMLRVPLETGAVTLSRAGRSTTYPALFQLLMATNPCPCGCFGSKDKLCLCSSHAIEQYWKKFSGPLLDRIDIRVHVQSVSRDEGKKSRSTEELRKDIGRAVLIQRKRQGIKNARLTAPLIKKFCPLTKEAEGFLDSQCEKNSFSSRAKASCIKLSRTIADMEQKEMIGLEHVMEAVTYRKTQGGLEMEFSNA